MDKKMKTILILAIIVIAIAIFLWLASRKTAATPICEGDNYMSITWREEPVLPSKVYPTAVTISYYNQITGKNEDIHIQINAARTQLDMCLDDGRINQTQYDCGIKQLQPFEALDLPSPTFWGSEIG